jgi:chromosome segregation ATPase
LIKIKDKEFKEKLTKNHQQIKGNEENLKKCEKSLLQLTTMQNQSKTQLLECQNTMQSQHLNITSELIEKSKNITQLESQLIDLQTTHSKSLEKIESLTTENQNFIKSCNTTNSTLQHIDMESLPNDLDEKLKEFKKLDNQLRKRETDLKQFEIEVANTISALTKSKEKIEKVLKHKNQEIVRKDNELKKLRAANNQLQNKNNQLQTQLKEIKLRSMDLDKIVREDIASAQELNRTKSLLEIEKLKFQELEVKLNGTLENKTIECLVHQDLQASNQLQQKIENSNDTEINLGDFLLSY